MSATVEEAIVGLLIEPGDAAFHDPRAAQWLRDHGIRADCVQAIELYRAHFVVHRLHRHKGKPHVSARCPDKLHADGSMKDVCRLPKLSVPLSIPFPEGINCGAKYVERPN